MIDTILHKVILRVELHRSVTYVLLDLFASCSLEVEVEFPYNKSSSSWIVNALKRKKEKEIVYFL